MTNLPAITGWNWIKDGFALFLKRPGPLTILFVSYSFFMFLLGFIPFLGQVVPPLLTPVFSMVIMSACAQIDQDAAFDRQQLRKVFEPPVLPRLLGLGVVYVLLAFVTIGLVWVFIGGGFTPFSPVDAKTLANNSGSTQPWVLLLIALFGLLYVPLFWFAAPLIVWQQSSVGKAIFYSFFSVLRNLKAFIVFFLSWLLVGAILPAMLSVTLATMLGLPFLGMIMLFVLSIVLTIVMYASCYTSYKQVFGLPELPRPAM